VALEQVDENVLCVEPVLTMHAPRLVWVAVADGVQDAGMIIVRLCRGGAHIKRDKARAAHLIRHHLGNHFDASVIAERDKLAVKRRVSCGPTFPIILGKRDPCPRQDRPKKSVGAGVPLR